MAFGICNLSIVPVRAEASDKSEMVTQLLFGESFEITQKRGNWLHIRCDYDQYKGWIDHKQYLPLSDEAHAALLSEQSAVVSDLLMIAEPEDPMQAVTVMLGSSLPQFKDGFFQLGEQQLEFSGNIAEASESREMLMQYALMYLNTPYLWGGRSPFGCKWYSSSWARLCHATPAIRRCWAKHLVLLKNVCPAIWPFSTTTKAP
jgi:gamma-D-glutamyl-L-lysine dipeptidyl-peptidase